MGKIQELLKEKLVIRATNPERSSTLGILVDNAKKMAKSQLREVCDDDDLVTVAKKMKNEALGAIEEYKKGHGDFSHLEKEIIILEEFIPAGLSEEDIKKHVENIISSSEEKTVKNIMTALKLIPGMDMKIAKKYVDMLL